MVRVAPIADRSEVAHEFQEVVDGVLATFGSFRGPHSIMLHSPQMEAPVLALGNFFRSDSTVKSPERELAVITAAREKDCVFVWAAQVANGRRVGVREEAIACVRDRGDATKLAPDEAADFALLIPDEGDLHLDGKGDEIRRPREEGGLGGGVETSDTT